MKTFGWLLLFPVCFHTGLGEVRWCTISEQELKKCDAMKTAFAGANILPALACVQGSSAITCVQMISDQKADAVTLDGGIIYQAGKDFNLKPVVGESYGQELGSSYYAVAVVRKDSTITINSLKGLKSCHTGMDRTAGWNVPVGYLIDSGRVSAVGCNIFKAVGEFFSQSCVPGAGSTNVTSLCELCVGDGHGQSKCELSPRELYFDYSGAFRCLAEGAGDVAFVKHSTVFENTDESNPDVWAQGLRSQDFQLLCRDGSRADVTEWRKCNLARVPAHAVVARPDANALTIFQLLDEGQKRFGTGSPSFTMFDSTAYGGKNLLFKDSTTELIPIPDQTYETWLGQDYLQAVRALSCDPRKLPESLGWCTLSTAEIWKCSDMAVAFNSKTLNPPIRCISGDSTEECMKMIQAKQADAITLDGGDIYKAGKIYGLVPAAGERYFGEQNANYYAVAVVKKSSSDAFTINDLKGKKSCHTGYERTAGWNVPVNVLIDKGFITPKGCDIVTAVGEFFSKSCVPGANQNGFPATLCALCKGDEKEKKKCVSGNEEPYFSYSGAFRCLVEDAGDVAFVKHSTVLENTDGMNPASWAANLKSSDFQLLCPNGARAEVNQYAGCNWAPVPAHAVMVRPDTNTYAVFGLLNKAQDFFGYGSNASFKMFNSLDYEGKDLLFKDSTIKIVPVEEKTTYLEWLGKEYIKTLEGVRCPSAAAANSVNVALLLLSSFLLLNFHL
ncbi:melanotransferrin isoform X2 [Microcaecilia unicolor]|uniref:Melanotransferrin n=1 Tax=Microcaecilia unicolor TaxID=1415580 RepID=A0A6P7Z481_9AMPH|nr:melanotransferrin isoform X2 [Microcaecilia unicolor]